MRWTRSSRCGSRTCYTNEVTGQAKPVLARQGPEELFEVRLNDLNPSFQRVRQAVVHQQSRFGYSSCASGTDDRDRYRIAHGVLLMILDVRRLWQPSLRVYRAAFRLATGWGLRGAILAGLAKPAFRRAAISPAKNR
jgi:hypothetical protein